MGVNSGTLREQTMGISKYDVEVRDRAITESKNPASFLDAVFCIHYYNYETKHWGPLPKLPDITPEEVFGEFDQAEYQTCLEKSKALLLSTAYVGESAHKYPGAMPYEAALERMRKENPGFSPVAYERTAYRAMVAMR
ncbi:MULTISPECIES: hypothetical protein [Methylomonas]|nr:hypothetical protein [Methylomonas koyamae]